jgi:hypothetical protein
MKKRVDGKVKRRVENGLVQQLLGAQAIRQETVARPE